jgi:hypothetical protein
VPQVAREVDGRHAAATQQALDENRPERARLSR